MRRSKRRELAKAIVMLRVAECYRLHAVRDTCFMHAVFGSILHQQGVGALETVLPASARDEWWWHRRVEMPAARMDARELDRERA